MDFSATIISRPLPANIKEEDTILFNRLLSRKINSPEILKINNVYAFDKGVVFKNFLPVKELLHQNDESYFLPYTIKDLFKSFLRNRVEYLSNSQTYLLVVNLYSASYYHWLIEAMPRLFLIRESIESGVLLLPENCNQSFHLAILEIFNIHKIQHLRAGIAYRIKQLISPTEIGRMANSDPSILRDSAAFIKTRVPLNLNLGEKIYISRQKADKRKINNETEIIDFLKANGFTVVYLEDHSFKDQVSIMHHCKYVVGLHGAGFSNLIFMKEGGSVLELRKHDKGENYFFFTLSCAMNIKYYYQFCEGMNNQSSVQEDDVFVSLEEFKKNVYHLLKGE